jgi:hypothetical protein
MLKKIYGVIKNGQSKNTKNNEHSTEYNRELETRSREEGTGYNNKMTGSRRKRN